MTFIQALKAFFGYPPKRSELQIVADDLYTATTDLLDAKKAQESANAAVSALTTRKARLAQEHERLLNLRHPLVQS